MRIGFIEVRVQVGAAGEDEPVEHGERLFDALFARRDDERPSSRSFHRTHIGERHDRGRLDPVAPRYLLGVRRDADDRPHGERLDAEAFTNRARTVDTWESALLRRLRTQKSRWCALSF
jgi:hypothetical protein